MPLPISGAAHEKAIAADDFVWFIYGSSLDRGAFEAWALEHGYAVPDFSRAFVARLDGWRLCFDVASRYWGGAVGSLTETPGASVEGVALPMSGTARGLADHKEGAVSGLYQPVEIRVQPVDGGALVRAVAYIASPDRRLPTEAPASVPWLETVLRGARAARLSSRWIEELERQLGRSRAAAPGS